MSPLYPHLPHPVWESIEEFYAEDPRREESREVDFGVQWRMWWFVPTYRLTYVVDTC